MTPAEERAERENLAVVRLVPLECLRIAQGNPMICRQADGTEVLVRLFRADELVLAHINAAQHLGMDPTMTHAQAEELVRPL